MIVPLGRFLVLPAAERRRLLEAVCMLFAVRLVLAVLPFRLALRLLRIAPGEAPGAGRVAAAEAQEIGRAIDRAARHVPFRAVCLQQAFAAVLMLRRRGLDGTLYLGLARPAGGDGLAAHAWSRCGAVPVTGVAAAEGFVQVAVFAA